jgi:hypothetical protein
MLSSASLDCPGHVEGFAYSKCSVFWALSRESSSKKGSVSVRPAQNLKKEEKVLEMLISEKPGGFLVPVPGMN